MNDVNTMAIEANQLEVRYKGTAVLRGLTLQVRRGEVYALLGGNGAGKSTTLSAFLGFVECSKGTVQVCGLDPARNPVAVRAQVAYVPENVALYEHLTARENMQYFLRLAGAGADAQRIETALTSVRLDSTAWDRKLGGFSKGMRQKVAIALALARSVPVLLLDEPTTGLDPQATSDFNQLLKTLKEKHVAIFMVTHDLLGAAEVADRIGFLDRGIIIEEFTAAGTERFDIRMLYEHYAAGRTAA
ncbi:MAG TPA: ABC transporter ATP-binding protein [Noviherbaspirillum sp.]|jgi:ABC-2 type transport system ATP-binding protein|uniref:ABC transporter ATP-binding protein n=1 Tax=Noviherbaspirillum sp. TaxID=1926288 RepID=UPI002DDD382C|nr:ABC transporter ATP-binding protein [Noviherbaspirillum sp.]HEV2612950.1 ABC transporter ATP-binding protein [Noviherbaspirillum sp.]